MFFKNSRSWIFFAYSPQFSLYKHHFLAFFVKVHLRSGSTYHETESFALICFKTPCFEMKVNVKYDEISTEKSANSNHWIADASFID